MKNKFKFLSIILIFLLYSCKQNENIKSSNAVENENENIVHSNATENENKIAIDEDNTNKTINIPDDERIKNSLVGKIICGTELQYGDDIISIEIQNKSISKDTLIINVIISLEARMCWNLPYKLLFNWENNNWVLYSLVNEDNEENHNE